MSAVLFDFTSGHEVVSFEDDGLPADMSLCIGVMRAAASRLGHHQPDDDEIKRLVKRGHDAITRISDRA